MNNTGNAVPSTSPLDLQDNAVTLDQLINGDAIEVTSRTGKVLKGIAALQAIITSLDLGSFTFADTAAGLAGTSSGQYFRVPQSIDGGFVYYVNTNGVAGIVATLPGADALKGAGIYSGYIPDSGYYKKIINSGISDKGALTSNSTADCAVISVSERSEVYVISSKSDFSLGKGLGGAFFDVLNVDAATAPLTPIYPVDTGIKGAISGRSVFKLTVPENAKSLIINTRWDQYNPDGFTIDLYETLSSASAEDKRVEIKSQTTVNGENISGYNALSTASLKKIAKLDTSGNLVLSAYMQFNNKGINNTGAFSGLNSAVSVAINVIDTPYIYLLNTAGDFSAENGRGFGFFTSESDFSSGNIITDYSVLTYGKDAQGITVFGVTVPEEAKSLIVNTAFTQYNPSGFSVYISDELSDVLNRVSTLSQTRIKSLYGRKLLGIDVEQDFGYRYTGSLKRLATQNPSNYGVKDSGEYGPLNTARSENYPVSDGDILYVYNSAGDFSAGAGRGLSFFDYLDKFISMPAYVNSGVTVSGYPLYKVTAPENAVKMIVNTAFTQYNPNGFKVGVYSDLNQALNESEQLPTRVVHSILGEDIAASGNEPSTVSDYGLSRFLNKSVFIFGDSISTTNYNGGWVPYFVDATGCVLTNFATNGSMADRMVDKLVIDGMARRKTTDTDNWPKPDFTNCKAVMLMIGTNDQPEMPTQSLDSLIPSGRVYDFSSPIEYWNQFSNDYVGNVSLFIEYCKYKNPNMEFFIMSNIHRQDDKSKMDRVSTLCSQIAKYYSIHHVDCTNNAGFSYKYLAELLQDGIHPNLNGMKKLGTYISNAVVSN